MWSIGTLCAGLIAVAGVSKAAGPCPPSGALGRYDYQEALCMSILFFEAQRSGRLPPDLRFDWRFDSSFNDGQDVGLDLSGGYYDAGDHVKFGFPLANSMLMVTWGLLSYRGGYERAGQVEYAEAAIRWGTDFMLMAHSANMTLYGQVGDGDADHAWLGRPEDMTMDRPSWKVDTEAPGSDLAGETSAAFAAAAILFQDSDPEYSVELLTASRALFDFADHAVPRTLSHLHPQCRGILQVLFSELFGDQLYLESVGTAVSAVRAQPHTPGGMVYTTQWGSQVQAMNVAFVAFKAADLGIDAEVNRAWGQQQVNYALGSSGRSFMVGFGVNPPQRPHHRASSFPDLPEPCDDGWALNQDGPNPQVLYGGLVGGPDGDDGFVDDRNDFVHNEVSLLHNCGITAALAAVISLS